MLELASEGALEPQNDRAILLGLWQGINPRKGNGSEGAKLDNDISPVRLRDRAQYVRRGAAMTAVEDRQEFLVVSVEEAIRLVDEEGRAARIDDAEER